MGWWDLHIAISEKTTNAFKKPHPTVPFLSLWINCHIILNQHVQRAKMNKLHIGKSQPFNTSHLLFTITRCMQRLQNPQVPGTPESLKIMIIIHSIWFRRIFCMMSCCLHVNTFSGNKNVKVREAAKLSRYDEPKILAVRLASSSINKAHLHPFSQISSIKKVVIISSFSWFTRKILACLLF